MASAKIRGCLHEFMNLRLCLRLKREERIFEELDILFSLSFPKCLDTRASKLNANGTVTFQ